MLLALDIFLEFLSLSLSIAYPTSCQFNIECPCGSTNQTYTFCVSNFSTTQDFCKRWERCEECNETVEFCTKCPPGLSGSTCATAIGRLGVTCPDPGIPPGADRTNEDGRISILSREFLEGESAIFSCLNNDTGLIGSSLLTCLANGTWSAPIPQCTRQTKTPTLDNGRIFCSNPGVNANGKILYAPVINLFRRNEGYPKGSEVVYGCQDGYDLEGPLVIYCTNTGKWSDFPPTCKQRLRGSEGSGDEDTMNLCGNPGLILNGWFQVISIDASQRPRRLSENQYNFTTSTRLQYYCEERYWLRGNDIITCGSIGSWSADPPICEAECGKSTMLANHGITNGKATLAGQWPWVVAIWTRKINVSVMKCAGTLINARTVLTAAHCIENVTSFTLYFGNSNPLDSVDDVNVVMRMSSQLIPHPRYNATSYENDIAVIKFFPRIWFSERIQPICLPSLLTSAANLQPDRFGYIVGWGLTEKGQQSDDLTMAYIPVQSNNKCSRAYEQQRLRDRIKPGMFCAGLDQGITSACTGDSGSALVFYDSKYQRHFIEGIVSFAIKGHCGVPGFYTVFTKVSDYVNWILMQIS